MSYKLNKIADAKKILEGKMAELEAKEKKIKTGIQKAEKKDRRAMDGRIKFHLGGISLYSGLALRLPEGQMNNAKEMLIYSRRSADVRVI